MIHVHVVIVLIEAVIVKFVLPKSHVIFFVLTKTNSQGETIYKSFYIIGFSMSTHPIVDRICTLKYYKILYTVNLFCKFSSMSGSCSLESGCFCQAFVCLWNIIHVRGINIWHFFSDLDCAVLSTMKMIIKFTTWYFNVTLKKKYTEK